MSNFTPKVKRVEQSEEEQLKFAFALAKEKRVEEALAEFQAVLQKKPTAKLAHIGAGNLLFKQKRYDEALPHFQAVMKLDPLRPKAPLAAGRVYLKLGNLEQALEEFQTVLSINPNFAPAYQGIGQVLAKQKQFDQAIQQLRNALRLDPQLVSVRLLIAQAYQRQGKLTEALAELKSAININPKIWRLYQALGRVYLKQKKYAEALEAFQQVINLNSEPSVAIKVGLVKTLIEANQLEKAAETLRELPTGKRLQIRKHKLWGELYQRQGLFKEAAEEFRAASILAAEEGDTLDDLTALDALLEEDEDKWQEAVEPYKTAAEKRMAEDKQRRRASRRESRANASKS